MWPRIASWFKIIWDAGDDINKQGVAIRKLQESNQYLVRTIEFLLERDERREKELGRRLRQESEKRADELEKIELRLRLQISEELRRLPPRDE